MTEKNLDKEKKKKIKKLVKEDSKWNIKEVIRADILQDDVPIALFWAFIAAEVITLVVVFALLSEIQMGGLMFLLFLPISIVMCLFIGYCLFALVRDYLELKSYRKLMIKCNMEFCGILGQFIPN